MHSFRQLTQTQNGIVDYTSWVKDVRTLRAAAFVPYVFGLTFLIVAAPLSYASGERIGAAESLGCSAALFLDANLIRRGSVVATLVLAACVAASVVIALASLTTEKAQPGDTVVLVTFSAVLAFACWGTTRAVGATLRLRPLSWRLPSPGGLRKAISQVPADNRLVRSLAPLAGATGLYAAGMVVAVVVAVSTGHALFAGLAALPFVLPGSRVLQRARRTLALRVADVRAADSRRPLLLVRSFQDDNLELEPRFGYFGTLFGRRVTLEDFIVSHLGDLGPVIAIGKPGERLSPLGAAREYVYGAGWQERVSTVLDECSYVISILGSTESVLWEYDQILQRGMAHRLLIVIPPVPIQVICARWNAFARVFPPATGLRLSLHEYEQACPPVYVMFSEGCPPVVLCNKYQNETGYSTGLALLLPELKIAIRGTS